MRCSRARRRPRREPDGLLRHLRLRSDRPPPTRRLASCFHPFSSSTFVVWAALPFCTSLAQPFSDGPFLSTFVPLGCDYTISPKCSPPRPAPCSRRARSVTSIPASPYTMLMRTENITMDKVKHRKASLLNPDPVKKGNGVNVMLEVTSIS